MRRRNEGDNEGEGRTWADQEEEQRCFYAAIDPANFEHETMSRNDEERDFEEEHYNETLLENELLDHDERDYDIELHQGGAAYNDVMFGNGE